MRTNPLDTAAPFRAGSVTVEMLQALAASLNRSRFVADSGLPYFVGRRTEDNGTTLHFLDRKMAKGFNQ